MPVGVLGLGLDVVYYCRKLCAGGGVKIGDVCYGMLRAAACVYESDHHALMYGGLKLFIERTIKGTGLACPAPYSQAS